MISARASPGQTPADPLCGQHRQDRPRPFVSALFGGTWGNMNGIIGRIELAATPPVWIDDVQVYPDVDKKIGARCREYRQRHRPGRPGTLSVGTQSVKAAWDANGGRAEVEVDMSGAKLWDEFSPNLSEVTVKLGDDERTVRFGMRKFAARGTQFTMNGRPLFLRGTLECSVLPLTGYPPTDVAAWQRIFRIMKSYGLNLIRFHSWCPPEAAFAAADLEGIMIQAEGPQANVRGRSATRRATRSSRRSSSGWWTPTAIIRRSALMTLGNEYGGKDELLTRWVDMLIQARPAPSLFLGVGGANHRQPPVDRSCATAAALAAPARSATCATSWPVMRGRSSATKSASGCTSRISTR